MRQTPETRTAARMFYDTERLTAELLQEAKHFSSGVNTPGDARGLAGSYRHVGIAATDIRPGLLEELFTYEHTIMRLFVDSGAFGEVAFGPEGVRVVKPITGVDWDRIFTVMLRCVVVYGKRCRVVAPDRIGCQATTLERLATYAGRVQLFAELGAQIIVPVQKGELPMSEMFRRSIEILGLSAEEAIAGIPMKKDATSLADLRELVESLPELCRIHLLGIGPESPRFDAVIELILSLRPEADITSDSVTIRRLVGRTNGPGGGPRSLTKYQDIIRETERGCPPIGLKAIALFWQGADEVGFDRWSQGAAIGLRSDLRQAVDVADLERAEKVRAKRIPQLKLVVSDDRKAAA